MTNSLRIIVLLSSILYTSAFATIINIPTDYPTIQLGIDASADGDTVLVQPGTYVENVNFNGHNIVLGSLFLTTGDTSYISQTVIDGDSVNSVVRFENSEDSTAEIQGFCLFNGLSEYGGGIYIQGSNPIISYNKIINNTSTMIANGKGGGIGCHNSNPKIRNNIINNNYSDYVGGAINCEDSNPTITGNIICQNIARTAAAGISCYNSDPYIDGNIISQNDASTGVAASAFCCWDNSIPIISNNTFEENAGFMGAIFCLDSYMIFFNNIIRFNDTHGSSMVWIAGSVAIVFKNDISNNQGGLSCYQSSLIVKNNIISNNYFAAGITCSNSVLLALSNVITGNYGSSFAGGIICFDSDPDVVNTIIWGNDSPQVYVDNSNPEITFSNIEGGWSGTGNIDVDPLFRDPDNGDFHLTAVACGDSTDSPCVDAGDPNILDSLLDCSWGLGGPRSDMGAYGGGDSLITVILENQIPIPRRFMLFQNYPNPFNASTTIRFVLPNSQNVHLAIYDLLGREVKTLLDEYRQAGVHTITFDASHFSSGVYFYRLKAGEKVETKRMVLLK